MKFLKCIVCRGKFEPNDDYQVIPCLEEFVFEGAGCCESCHETTANYMAAVIVSSNQDVVDSLVSKGMSLGDVKILAKEQVLNGKVEINFINDGPLNVMTKEEFEREASV